MTDNDESIDQAIFAARHDPTGPRANIIERHRVMLNGAISAATPVRLPADLALDQGSNEVEVIDLDENTARRHDPPRRQAVLAVAAVATVAAVAALVAGAVALVNQQDSPTQLDTEIAAGTQPDSTDPVATTDAEVDPDAAPGAEAVGEGDDGLDPPPTLAPDEGLTQNEAASTPARLLREIETTSTDHDNEVPLIRWRLVERGADAGRCLEVTAIVDDVVHSRGGACHRFPDPSPGAWDLDQPLRFELPGQAFLVLFGRAGADVASVQLSDPFPSHDADVDGAWIAVVLAADGGAPYETIVEAFDRSGLPLLAERVRVDPFDASILNTTGLIAELQIAGAAVTEIPSVGDADDSISPFFAGSQRVLCVDGQQVRLYEYDSVSNRLVESNQITADGQLRGPETFALVSWIGPPRFFAAGNLIALHLANDPETLSLLTEILGPTLSPDAVGSRGTGDPPCDNG